LKNYERSKKSIVVTYAVKFSMLSIMVGDGMFASQLTAQINYVLDVQMTKMYGLVDAKTNQLEN
jgi:hypothetical protein